MNWSVCCANGVDRVELRSPKWMLWLALSVCVVAQKAPGYGDQFRSLNPTTYRSASNGFALLVDPSDKSGRGSADYHLSKGGATVWTNRQPFTLWEAVVSDAGEVAGYAYTHGWNGFSGVPGDRSDGEFLIVVFSPQGEVIHREVHAREGSRFFHQPPNPLAEGVLLWNQGKQFAVRIHDPDLNRRVENWWIYDIASGESRGSFAPSQFMTDRASLSIVAARPVRGTPLTLVHWWRYRRPDVGAMFTLIDENGQPAWTLRRENDYRFQDDEAREDEVRRRIREGGGILESGLPGAFALWFVKDQAKVSFSLEAGANNQWRVREIARRDWPEKPQPTEALEFPPLQLVAKPPIQLEAANAGPANPINDIAAFAFDDQGRPVVMQPGGEGTWSLSLVSDEGEVLKRLELTSRLTADQIGEKCLAWTGQGRFVAALSESGRDARVDCFQIDFETETATRLENFECPTITALAGFPDGRFAALTSRHQKYTMTDGFFIFDAKGGLLWKREQDGSRGEPGELLNPQDIAAFGNDTVAILDNVHDEIQLFNLSGRYRRSIKLSETWGREPNYLSGLACDETGGFVIYDFDAEYPVVRTDPAGAITSQFVPQLDGGRRFPIRHGVRISPIGELWTSDGRALLRIAGDGKIDRLIGDQLSLEFIREPGAIMLGFDDRLYIADKRTKAVHVFSTAGQCLGVCVPDAADLTEISSVEHIAVTSDHQVFFPLEFGGERYLHFDAGLQRRGWVESTVDQVSNDWHFQPDTNRMWIAGYNDLFLMENRTNIVRKISRRMDGQWLDIIQPSGSASARDGSIAVIAKSNTGEQTVNVFDRDGEPLAMIVLPSSWSYFRQFVYDGRRVFFRTENQIYLYHLDGKPAGRIDLEGLSGYDDRDWDGPFLAGRGDELWFVDSKRLTVNRFSLP